MTVMVHKVCLDLPSLNLITAASQSVDLYKPNTANKQIVGHNLLVSCKNCNCPATFSACRTSVLLEFHNISTPVCILQIVNMSPITGSFQFAFV